MRMRMCMRMATSGRYFGWSEQGTPPWPPTEIRLSSAFDAQLHTVHALYLTNMVQRPGRTKDSDLGNRMGLYIVTYGVYISCMQVQGRGMYISCMLVQVQGTYIYLIQCWSWWAQILAFRGSCCKSLMRGSMRSQNPESRDQDPDLALLRAGLRRGFCVVLFLLFVRCIG